jgi:4,5-dihydroxyphthalate decarboxylase
VGFARSLMGEDFWPYGIAPNRKAIDAFLRHHFAQGLSPRLLQAHEMFHPGTHESFKI